MAPKLWLRSVRKAPGRVCLRLFYALSLIVALYVGYVAWGLRPQAPELDPTGGCSHYFSFELSFEEGPKPALIATLQNRSGRSLRLRVSDRQFHGTVFLITSDHRCHEMMLRDFLPIYMTSIYDVPGVEMRADERITWRVPIDELEPIGQPLSPGDWSDCTVIATLGEVGVAKGKTFSSGNAQQVAYPLSIPRRQ